MTTGTGTATARAERAARFFVNFFAVRAQLRRKMTKFEVDLRAGMARR